MHKILLPIFATSLVILANTTVPSDKSNLKITIYNDNRAFINDTREVEVKTGLQKLVYEGVPSSVITQSVIPNFTGVETNLYSQNYSYDLISLKSLLKHSINKKVTFYTNGEKPELSEGILLSDSPYVIVQETSSNEIYTLNSPTQVIFSQIPKNMITKPSLVWNMEIQNSGKLGIDLKYLATGVSWKSDYVLNLKKDTLDLTGWITLNNNSGVTYKDAQITCLAGDVNKVKKPNIQKSRSKVFKYSSPKQDVKEESFSGYHIYKIPFKETIANKQQKQILFIDKKNIAYHQYGKNTNSSFEKYKEKKLIFTNTIEFQNSKENNIGLPLPTGIVRMYQNDNSNETHFIGEQKIYNIPKDEKVKLKIGTLFDVTGEKTITKYIAKSHYENIETTYNIRNRGEKYIELKIEEIIPTYGNQITVNTSCEEACSVEKKSAFIREFTIKLKPKEKYIFTSEFEVKF